MFIAALFLIANQYEQPRCSPTHEWTENNQDLRLAGWAVLSTPYCSMWKSPGKLLKVQIPCAHPRTIKSGRLGVGARHQWCVIIPSLFYRVDKLRTTVPRDSLLGVWRLDEGNWGTASLLRGGHWAKTPFPRLYRLWTCPSLVLLRHTETSFVFLFLGINYCIMSAQTSFWLWAGDWAVTAV